MRWEPKFPSRRWEAPPPRPPLADGDVHVWRGRLDSTPRLVEALLSPEEQARARRFRSDHDRDRWVSAHGLLRLVLSEYVAGAPDELVLRAASPRDKPYLVAPNDEPLRFSLAHSGDLAMIAVARGIEVGIDVETERNRDDLLAIARRVLRPAVVDALERTPTAEQASRFFAAWTRHEAQAKCVGAGLEEPDRAGDLEDLPVVDLDVGAGYAAALAVERAAPTVRLWDWT